MRTEIDTAYEDFANAIIKKAADDYRNALDGLGYDQKDPDRVIREIERFFHSKWFKILTSVDGDYLIEKIRQEHEEKERSRNESNIIASNA
jgi:hypothetical protein